MVFLSEKIPYPLNFGIDLSHYKDIFFNHAIEILPEIVSQIDELNFDYFITNISRLDRQKVDIENFSFPIFIDDYSLFSHEWKNKFAGKLHDEYLSNISDNYDQITVDLDYLSHLNSKFILINSVSNNKDNFLLQKLVRKFLVDNPDKFINVTVNLNKEGLENWQKLYSELGHLDNLAVNLCISSDLPEEDVVSQFICHNIKSIVIPLSIFVTNKNGFPVLSKPHQDFIKFLFGYKVDVIFEDDCKILIKEEQSGGNNLNSSNNKNSTTGSSKHEMSKFDLKDFTKIRDYYLYLGHLFTTHREFKNEDYVLCNYLDVFQIPLQPLKDNLQSQTYECFEEDKVKYDYYENALNKALKNYKEKGQLSLQALPDKIIYDKNSRVFFACILGGGRGPLVRKVVNSALFNGFKIGSNFKVYCVEKNRNAFNTLLNLKIKEPEIFGNVNFIYQDMREFKPTFKIDIIVSELLGSFGDNELSPECLYNIQNYLSEDSIMIPHSYTSYLRPITSPVVWSNYVILLHKAYYPFKEVAECFTFTHPVKEFKMFKQFLFQFNKSGVVHGFAGYFKTTLYDDVELSTIPYDHTPGMFSWFPIYFPSTNPIEVRQGENMRINIVRENDGKKVWYEWNFEVENKLDCSNNQIHNLGGSSFSIML